MQHPLLHVLLGNSEDRLHRRPSFEEQAGLGAPLHMLWPSTPGFNYDSVTTLLHAGD
jgi:hypothetical protein